MPIGGPRPIIPGGGGIPRPIMCCIIGGGGIPRAIMCCIIGGRGFILKSDDTPRLNVSILRSTITPTAAQSVLIVTMAHRSSAKPTARVGAGGSAALTDGNPAVGS